VGGTATVLHARGKAVIALAVAVFLVCGAAIAKAVGVGWGAATFLGALSLLLFIVGVRVQGELDMGAKEIESLKAGLAGAQSQPAPLIGGTWTGNTFEHFGQFVGTGLPGGAIQVTPGLLEFDPPQTGTCDLGKGLYAVSLPDTERIGLEAGITAVPKDWAEARLDELGETWRLAVYSTRVAPRELMAGYEPPTPAP
jgi:hypothetical protein